MANVFQEIGTIIGDVGAYLPKVLPFLQGLVSAGVVKTSTGTEIGTIIADVEQVIADKGDTTKVAADLQALFQDLVKDGIIGGALANELLSGVGYSATFLANIHGGQVGVIKAQVGIDGVNCHIIAVPDGSSPAHDLGL
jgi:hypothetical protein